MVAAVHADGITLGSDIKGVSGVKDYMQAYIDKYDFEHEVITGAVDEKAQVTFSFWQDKVRGQSWVEFWGRAGSNTKALCTEAHAPNLNPNLNSYGRYSRGCMAKTRCGCESTCCHPSVSCEACSGLLNLLIVSLANRLAHT